MRLVKKSYLITLKGLLLAGYLIFFASQFNYRYYNAANYFVYNSSSFHTASTKAPAGQKMPRVELRHVNKQKTGYLSVDKRFLVFTAIQPAFVKATPPASIFVITRKFAAPRVVYFSPGYLPVNALRGPPCA